MTYVVGDIHGNLQAFDDILEQIAFNESDELYVLGDVIDRGKHGIEILQRIMNMPNVHMILGNHEYMMLDALNRSYEGNTFTRDDIEENVLLWHYNGGDVTHKAYRKLPKEEQAKIIRYLKSLPLNIDVDINDHTYKLVHATCEEVWEEFRGNVPRLGSKAYFCVWDRESIYYLTDQDDDITIIFGHTPTCHMQDAMPMKIYREGSIIGLDCGAGYPGNPMGGRLACIRLDDEEVFYSNFRK